MRMFIKNKIIIIAVLVAGFLFILFGRSIYMPLVHKVKGKQTVDSVIDHISDSVYDRLKANMEDAGLESFPDQLIIVGFKEEQKLQLYAETDSGIKFIKQYPFTAMSGGLGPKLERGDLQIPEGIYGIEYLNPNSSYYLSMKISYPNTFDKTKSSFSNVRNMGDNIFIHGCIVRHMVYTYKPT